MDPLEKFLYQYKVQKGDGKRFTHTRIGGKKEDGHYPIIYPGIVPKKISIMPSGILNTC